MKIDKILVFDGAMGSLLQQGGMPLGFLPENYNLQQPERIKKIHKMYLDAGANVISANTFGANGLKFDNVSEIVSAGVKNALDVAKNYNAKVALDIGPLGKMLVPSGELQFEQAVQYFSEIVTAGKDADIILIETMTDIYEAKAAVLAAKECSDLPIFCSMTLDESGRTMMGSSPEVIAATLEGLGVDVIGFNCGQGAENYLPFAKRLLDCTSVPVMLQPNAGIPFVQNGQTVFPQSAKEFAQSISKLVGMGVMIVGGCCGTTPEHIGEACQAVANFQYQAPVAKCNTVVCSYGKAVKIGESPVIIGERLNPTGKKRIATALREKNWGVLLDEANAQSNARILDVNAGLPDIDEADVLSELVCQLQSVSTIPLQIDSTRPEVLERTLRLYNGKAVLNSVCGKQESLDKVLPIAAKYGAVVVGLTLDEDGIPNTAEQRFEIAKKIEREAMKYGIPKHDLLIDPLTLTASTQQHEIRETLKCLVMLRNYGMKSVLGVSNVSFGLPKRELLNSNFLALAIYSGLDACIINPSSQPMIDALNSCNVLTGTDSGCVNYIAAYSESQQDLTQNSQHNSLQDCIEKGFDEYAGEQTTLMLKTIKPIEIIENHIVPALHNVGKQYETGQIFLPQLMKSAKAAQASFAEIKKDSTKTGTINTRGKMVIATVHGDIHDIGKNIVATMVENFGFEVVDLGKNVPAEIVSEAVINEKVKLLGLSALMTTTVSAMEETIKLVKKTSPDCHIIVGGAVLSQSFAKQIGADGYAADAIATVKYVEEFFKNI